MLSIDLHKTFSTKQRNIDIYCKANFEWGQTTAIYGKSGVGKSTVLRMIAGLEKPDSGSIRLNNKVWFDASKNINLKVGERNMGFVFQEYNLFRNMTVEGNLKYASENSIISDEIIRLLEVTGLHPLLKSKPHQLSGGERQRISIIRALCQSPKLLLLDEPFSALDDASIGDLIREVSMIQKEIETTVIVVSHRKDVIVEMATSVVHMKDDNKVEQGDPTKLLNLSF